MGTATERVVILMTPAEKRSLESKARRLRASAAELVRRSVKAYDPAADDGQIEALLARLAATHRATLAALAKAERELEETKRHFARRDAADTPRPRAMSAP